MPTPHYGQPRYRVIADKLRQRIENGVLPPGTLLPAESMLTVEFRASRGTIRQAIAALREDGYVTTEHGRGTYINVRAYECNQHGGAESQTTQREVAADEALAQLFNVQVGTTLIEQQTFIRRGTTVETVTKVYKLRSTRP